MICRKTIDEPVLIKGVNVFNDRGNFALVCPNLNHEGVFYSDLSLIDPRKGLEIVPASLDAAFQNIRKFGARVLSLRGEKTTIDMVEHFGALLYGLGVDDATVYLSDGVCPRRDWGVSEHVKILRPHVVEKPGTSRRYVTLKPGLSLDDRTFEMSYNYGGGVQRNAGLVVEYSGDDRCYIDCEFDLPHAALQPRKSTFAVDEGSFREIASARGIIGPCNWIERAGIWALLNTPLLDPFISHGITDKNALILGSEVDTKYVNKSFPNGVYNSAEAIEHKAQDIVGTLALSGVRFKGITFRYFGGDHGAEVGMFAETFKRSGGIYRPCD